MFKGGVRNRDVKSEMECKGIDSLKPIADIMRATDDEDTRCE